MSIHGTIKHCSNGCCPSNSSSLLMHLGIPLHLRASGVSPKFCVAAVKPILQMKTVKLGFQSQFSSATLNSYQIKAHGMVQVLIVHPYMMQRSAPSESGRLILVKLIWYYDCKTWHVKQDVSSGREPSIGRREITAEAGPASCLRGSCQADQAGPGTCGRCSCQAGGAEAWTGRSHAKAGS